MKFGKRQIVAAQPKYPGVPAAVDGMTAAVEMEAAASEAAGACPIMPSTRIGEGRVPAGKTNVHGRPLILFEPEGEHAAAVTAGMSMMGLRATSFSGGQSVASMYESLHAAVAQRLSFVLNVTCSAMAKQSLNVYAGHDDYHAVDDSGFIQIFARNPQEVADLNLVAHRIAELSLNPAVCAQDGFLTSHMIESIRLPERELVKEYLGAPWDIIDSPTPSQRHVFGQQRRRVPEMFDLDYPAILGPVQNQDSYQQGVAAQRPFYFDHIAELADLAFEEYAALTGRHYARASGYRLEDAQYVIAGQGSVVCNAEAVCDYLRATRKLKVGVLNITMFRPFPADLVTQLLRGKKGVTVLERVDQPLAVDAPLLREIRAAMTQALENGRTKGTAPYPKLASCTPHEMPDFYSGCFGLGGRDLQPSDVVAAVENMLDGARKRRQFYLNVDFVRPDTRLPKLQIWQQQLLESYPHLAELALKSAEDVNLLPNGAVSLRVHSVGGWGTIAMIRELATITSRLLGLHVKANPEYGLENKGQPTRFRVTLAREPIRLSCQPKHVDVVLSPDPNVFRHSNPLAGLSKGGVLVVQSDLEPEEFWKTLPATARLEIQKKNIKVLSLDALKVAKEETTDPELQHRMLGAAFMGAFFRVSPLAKREGLEESKLWDGIRAQLTRMLEHLGKHAVEANLRAMSSGSDEVRELPPPAVAETEEEIGANPVMPILLDHPNASPGIGNQGRFWEQVCYLYETGGEGIADPFAAISAIPAATSSIRDMTDIRLEVPQFIPAKCTGCSKCWTQCPDAAIPGVVSTVEQVIEAAIAAASNGGPFDRIRQVVPHLARESRRIMKGGPFTTFADVLSAAYKDVAEKLNLNPERRSALDAEFGVVSSALTDFPLAKTAPFFDAPEAEKQGTGGLLSITVNPQACKGCSICAEVCTDGALVMVKQDEQVVDRLRRNWGLWNRLPETSDDYTKIGSVEEGIGVLPSLLLKKRNYRSMVGGDSACMGCGEKTVLHLVLSAVNALMLPRVERYIQRLDDLIARLDAKARGLLASDADLDEVAATETSKVGVPVDESKKEVLDRIAKTLRDLKDLRWRYKEGPSGNGRASCGMTNATGCPSVWGSTYPYNPYPFPWVNHLFQDAPSVAIGVFEGQMRKMADGFAAVRRAELELEGEYDAAVHEPVLSRLEWQQFSEEEFALCPPILAVGGDGTTLDAGVRNLSQLLVSGKPIRVVVLDTQACSNMGSQTRRTGSFAQASETAGFGPGQYHEEEFRNGLGLVAMAHREGFVLQSSQASPSHLLGGVLKGLQTRRPAVFLLHSPCPPGHGLGDAAANRAAKLALESRAFPIFVYDPDAGRNVSDRLSLDGNPAPEDVWPSYELSYVDASGGQQTMPLPLTVADWAATEGRFRDYFTEIADNTEDDDLLPFHEYLGLPQDEREEKKPFIYTVTEEKRLGRLLVAEEVVRLTEDRSQYWSQLRQMTGLEVAPAIRATMESEFEKRAEGLRKEYEAKLAELKAQYPRQVARRLAVGLLRAGNGNITIADLLAKAQVMPDEAAAALDLMEGASVAQAAPATAEAAVVEAVPSASAAAAAQASAEAAEELVMEPYIETARCTTCDECTNINKKMFAYNENKQAYIKDAHAGTFKQLVTAAEKCPVAIIHPASPLDPTEKDLEKWVKRAERFN